MVQAHECAMVDSLNVSAVIDDSKDNLDDDFYIGTKSHKFWRKSDWGAKAPSERVQIPEPLPYVLISHTATSTCADSATCQRMLRDMQQDHMTRTPAFADIAYSFLLSGDGSIYEGRGWGIRSPHHTFLKDKSLDVTFIGDFSINQEPTPLQVDALKKLLEYGVARCHIDSNYSLIPHNGTYSTLSPGRNVYKHISKWDHFEANPRSNLEKHEGKVSPCP